MSNSQQQSRLFQHSVVRALERCAERKDTSYTLGVLDLLFETKVFGNHKEILDVLHEVTGIYSGNRNIEIHTLHQLIHDRLYNMMYTYGSEEVADPADKLVHLLSELKRITADTEKQIDAQLEELIERQG